MGSTNQTPTLNLPLFSDDDRPTWRGDVNDAMSKIDAGVGADRGSISNIIAEFDQTTATNVANSESETAKAGDARWAQNAALGIVNVVNPSHDTLQAALTANAGRVVTSGTYTTDQTLTISGDADLSMLTINYTGNGSAVVVGSTTATLSYLAVKLPSINNASKVAPGWTAANVAGTVGVTIVNLSVSRITVPYVEGFERGLLIAGTANLGVQQCMVELGMLMNNKINCDFNSLDGTGYSNQNTFLGGRLAHTTDEGHTVAGTRHLRFAALVNPVNGNSFYGTSFESPDVVEYHVESASSVYNTLFGPRFENTVAADRKILTSGTSSSNMIVGGAYSDSIVQVSSNGGGLWTILSGPRSQVYNNTSNPTMWVENETSASNPSIIVTSPLITTDGTSPKTAYSMNISANTLLGKRGTDTPGNDRVLIDFSNSAIRFGDGTAPPAVTFAASSGMHSFSGATTTAGTALPATPAGYLNVRINGATQKIPYY